jgi:hypothetical protein
MYDKIILWETSVSLKRENYANPGALENNDKAQIKLVTDIICTGTLDGWECT